MLREELPTREIPDTNRCSSWSSPASPTMARMDSASPRSSFPQLCLRHPRCQPHRSFCRASRTSLLPLTASRATTRTCTFRAISVHLPRNHRLELRTYAVHFHEFPSRHSHDVVGRHTAKSSQPSSCEVDTDVQPRSNASPRTA